MWMLLTVSLLIAADGPYLTNSGVKTPTNATWSAVSPDGHVYMLDTTLSKLHVFNPKGELIQSQGRSGGGPGEFLNPSMLTLLGDRLIVTDSIAASTFKRDGTYLGKRRLPRPDAIYSPIKDGWLARVLFKDPPELWFYDFRMESPQKFHTFEPVKTNPPEGKIQPFDPTAALPGAIVSRDGKFIFVQLPNRFMVLIYDTASLDIVGQISSDEAPIPFDVKWGEAQLAEITGNLGPEAPLQYKADFPSHFPPIKLISLSPEGHLLITRWAAAKDKPLISAYNMKGEAVQSVVYDETSRRRIIARHGDDVYVSAFKNGQAAMARVSPAEVKSFITNNPVNFDWAAWMAKQQ